VLVSSLTRRFNWRIEPPGKVIKGDKMKAPYTFSQWIKKHYKGQWEGDIAPELLYDGYVWSLMQLGYEVFGNCYDGITVKMKVLSCQ